MKQMHWTEKLIWSGKFLPLTNPFVSFWILSLSAGMLEENSVMTEDTKDAKTFYSVKKHEAEHNFKEELSFLDSLFMMYRLRKKIAKVKTECLVFDNIRMYSHNFGDFVLYKSMNFISSYLETVAEEKNR